MKTSDADQKVAALLKIAILLSSHRLLTNLIVFYSKTHYDLVRV